MTPRIDGRQLRWQRHNDQRRTQVIDAALLVLEEVWPTAEVRVQQIADKAGINRSVLYRYFKDRTDLDVAVQQEICRRISDVLLPGLDHGGTPRAIVHRTVGAYVNWTVEHAALVRFAEQSIPGASHRPVDSMIELIAAHVEQLGEHLIDALDGTISAELRASLEPWIFGLIGGVMAAVRRWTDRPVLAPEPATFADVIAQSVWLQCEGLAGTHGITIPELPVHGVLHRSRPPADPAELRDGLDVDSEEISR